MKRTEKFKVSDIMNIQSSNGIYHAVNVTIYDEPISNSHPYVVRTSRNNGIRGYIVEDEATLNSSNTISFAQDTAQMFYQTEPYFTGNKVKIISLKDQVMTERVAIYLLSVMEKAFSAFQWGSSFDTALLNEVVLTLPILTSPDSSPIIDSTHTYSSQGFIPDFAYMEHYVAELEAERVAELEAERVAELEAYLRAADLDNYELTEDDREVLEKEEKGEIRKKEFKLGELFEAVNGNVDIQRSMTNGIGTPVVSSGVENNGIIGLSDIPARIIPANTITIDMFGHSFYRDYEYKLVTHARVFALIPKYTEMNSYTNLYIVTQLMHLPDIFSYAKMCTYDKAKNTTISLPIDSEGNICFAFMEKYIKAIEKLSIAGVVKYKDKIIEETKKLIA